MPVRDRERFVEQALRSALSQTRQDFEVIVWDDGSTDGTREILSRLAGVDPRCRVFFEPHRGVSRSMRLAHAHARGRYVGWLDSDDVLADTALEETSRILDTNPRAGMVYTNHLLIDERNKTLGLGRRCQIPYGKERLLVDFMTFHFRLFRREVFDAAGGIDDSFEAAYDYDFCLRVSEVASIVHLPRPLYAYRVHGGAISSAGRMVQIESAARAIRGALSRRGLDQTHELDVEIVGRYSIRPKASPPDPPG